MAQNFNSFRLRLDFHRFFVIFFYFIEKIASIELFQFFLYWLRYLSNSESFFELFEKMWKLYLDPQFELWKAKTSDFGNVPIHVLSLLLTSWSYHMNIGMGLWITLYNSIHSMIHCYSYVIFLNYKYLFSLRSPLHNSFHRVVIDLWNRLNMLENESSVKTISFCDIYTRIYRMYMYDSNN